VILAKELRVGDGGFFEEIWLSFGLVFHFGRFLGIF